MEEPIVKCEQVSFSYRDELVLDGISLTVRQGEFVTILGHNGSGKSTLAKHLNGLLKPADGEVWIAGMNTKAQENIREIRRIAGMVFQNPDNQIVATTVEEDIAFGMENLGIEWAEMLRRLEEVLTIVGLSDYRYHEPHHLSGGQKQRVAIAGILAMRPRLLILDEATAMLDPIGRKEVLETIQRLNAEANMTIIQITHDITEALLGSRIIVMGKGRILLDDTPEGVFCEKARPGSVLMDLPFSIKIQDALKEHGIVLDKTYLSVDELVAGICRYASKM
jgi:energy-coupling factor transport system ATP-binding protein